MTNNYECHGCCADVTTKHHWEYLEDRDDYDEEALAELEGVPLAIYRWCLKCVMESGMAYPDSQVCHDDNECLVCLDGCPDFFADGDAERYGITIDPMPHDNNDYYDANNDDASSTSSDDSSSDDDDSSTDEDDE